MAEYVTTNIRLPAALYKDLKRRALEEEKSLAQIVRESVERYLTEPESFEPAIPENMTREEWENDPLWSIGEDEFAGEADVTDGSVNHDYYLYGPHPARQFSKDWQLGQAKLESVEGQDE